MIFKFPKKVIVLDCFTYSENIITVAPIVPAIKLIPDWWRDLPQAYTEQGNFFPQGTMKNCSGMIEYYKKSFSIPLWSEVAIQIKPDKTYAWQFADSKTEATIHNLAAQATGFLNNFGHIKIHSPWRLQTKENVQWVWSQPIYNFSKQQELILPPAIVDFSNQNATHLNILFSLDTPKTIIVPHGQAMINLTPITENKIEIARHLVTLDEFQRKTEKFITVSFLKKHSKIISRKKQFKDCPFHNHTNNYKAQEK
jgi:hypothetical protein